MATSTRYISKRDKEYILYISKMIKSIFSKSPYIYIRESDNVAMIKIQSKTVYEFMRKYIHWNNPKGLTVRLNNINELSKEFIVGFLKGLIDTDGHINKNSKIISFSSISKKLIKNVISILNTLDIEHSIYTYRDKRGNRNPIFHARILKKDFDKFIKITKPFHFKSAVRGNFRAKLF